MTSSNIKTVLNSINDEIKNGNIVRLNHSFNDRINFLKAHAEANRRLYEPRKSFKVEH